MFKQSFGDSWFIGPRTSIFETFFGDGGVKQPVAIPHDAMLNAGRSADSPNRSHGAYFNGGTWCYTKEFDVPSDWETKSVILEFEGVYRDAMVYVNGDLAGQCAYGYSMFRVPLDRFLRYGDTNTIRVEARAGQDARWYTGAGIYRPVHLLMAEKLHIDPSGIRIATPQIDDELATVEVSATIVNEDSRTHSVVAGLVVLAPSGEEVARAASPVTVFAGESVVVRQRVYVRQPELWSAETPSLYSASVKLTGADLEGDESGTAFGIRTLTVDPIRGLRVNGETVKLRGNCLHHDNGVLGAATFAEAEERRIRILKQAGFNAIRSAHNPISVALLEACDRLGMYVMDETWDVWTESKTDDDYSTRFSSWWEFDVESMVDKDYNHPSVILYSIGNEIQEVGTRHGARRNRMIAEKFRALDPSRIVTNGINGLMALENLAQTIMDGASEDADDSVSFNSIVGDVGGMMNAIMAIPQIGERLAETNAGLQVSGLNYGEMRYEQDGLDDPNRIILGTETFPSLVHSYWSKVTSLPHVIGDFTWTAWDYLGEAGVARPVYPGDLGGMAGAYPWLTAGSGEIDITGQRRPRSYYREIVFGLRTDPYLAVQRPEHFHEAIDAKAWTWTDSIASWTWDAEPGAPITVEAYADADEIEFLVNGRAVARVAVGESLGCFAKADIAYEPGLLEAVAYTDGVEVGRTSLSTAAEATELRLGVEDPSSPEADLRFVRVSVCDPDGIVKPVTDVAVQVRIEGPAVLQGLGSARPSHEESYTGDTCTTYKGSALAVLRRTADGPVTVIVTADGFAEARVELAG